MNISVQRQIFPILNPVSGEIIGEKPRSEVHRSGDWHVATNAFIVRKGKLGSFDILIQERSIYADIAKNMLDQSLATQMLSEDEGDSKRTILRGLKEELGLDSNKVSNLLLFNRDNSIWLSKRYSYNQDILNREQVFSFGILLKDNVSFTLCNKINNVKWVGWEEFNNLITQHPTDFTKTSRIFVSSKLINKKVEKMFEALLFGGNWQPFSKQVNYLSDEYVDVVVYQSSRKAGWNVNVFTTFDSFKMISSKQNLRRKPFEIFKSDVHENVKSYYEASYNF